MEEKKYKDILKGIVEIIQNAEHSDIGFASICTYIGDHCPELGESEDERTRKAIIAYFELQIELMESSIMSEMYGDKKEEISNWIDYLEKLKDFDKQLEQAYKTADEVQYNRGYRAAMEEMEKQDKQTADCPQNNQDVNRPNGCITMEDFSGGEGFYKLNIEYLNKRQVRDKIENLIKEWELCTSSEAKYKVEAYKELIELIEKEEEK